MDQKVCRLSCRHALHFDCYSTLDAHARTEVERANASAGTDEERRRNEQLMNTLAACPACRGPGICISIWLWRDPNLITQVVCPCGAQAENIIDQHQIRGAQPVQAPVHQRPSAQPHIIPRLQRHDPIAEVSAESGADESTGSYPVCAHAQEDAAAWEQMHGGPWLPPDAKPEKREVYHSETRMRDGGSAVLIDTGSLGNLGGSEWCVHQAKLAIAHKRVPEQTKRSVPLTVNGVGKQAQRCYHDAALPVALLTTDRDPIKGKVDMPIIPDSGLPGIVGLASLRNSRSILDTISNRWYLLGPGDYDLPAHLPPGTRCVQCEYAPSGHMVARCDRFTEADAQGTRGSLDLEPQIALHAKEEASSSESPARL